jgi:hypothetical protein
MNGRGYKIQTKSDEELEAEALAAEAKAADEAKGVSSDVAAPTTATVASTGTILATSAKKPSGSIAAALASAGASTSGAVATPTPDGEDPIVFYHCGRRYAKPGDCSCGACPGMCIFDKESQCRCPGRIH